MDWVAVLHVAWAYLSAALLLGWLTTALFCAVAGTALANWGRLPWAVGFVLGLVALVPGLVLVALLSGVRAAQRRSERRQGVVLDATVAQGNDQVWTTQTVAASNVRPQRVHRPPTGSGWRAGVVRGWQRWTRTPATRGELVLAVVCVVAAIGAIAAVNLAWVKLVGPTGSTLYAAGPFELQLGLFVVLTAIATVAAAVGVLRWRSGWWPVLLAWCATWWAFLAVAALAERNDLDQLNRLIDDQVFQRVHVRQHLGIDLGPGWTVVLLVAVLMLVAAVGVLVLQRRDPRRAA